MQINISISDDGQVDVNHGGVVASTSVPTKLPESWWVEARTVFGNHQAAVARDDNYVKLCTDNWIGGMLKAAILIFPDLDHTELMREIMATTPQEGKDYAGIGRVVREAPPIVVQQGADESYAGATPMLGGLDSLGDLPSEDTEPEQPQTVDEPTMQLVNPPRHASS